MRGHVCPEDGVSMLLRNVGNHTPVCLVSWPRRPQFKIVSVCLSISVWIKRHGDLGRSTFLLEVKISQNNLRKANSVIRYLYVSRLTAERLCCPVKDTTAFIYLSVSLASCRGPIGRNSPQDVSSSLNSGGEALRSRGGRKRMTLTGQTSSSVL
jgi:hypothetical protein